MSTQQVFSIEDKDGSARIFEKFRRELGAVLIGELENPLTEDILLNADGKLWAKRIKQGFTRIGEMSPAIADSLIGTIGYMQGKLIVDSKRPILETTLPFYGSRFEGLKPPVVKSPCFAIRQQTKIKFTLEDYESAGILTDKSDPTNAHRHVDDFVARVQGKSHADILRIAVECHRNILVVGSTGSGKTTLANAILDCIGRVSPNDRLIYIEDTPELQCPIENSLGLLTSIDVSMLDCLKACMRLTPSRIAVGEVRGVEALALLKAWNTGHPGGFATVHANDAEAGLIRLESLVSEGTVSPQQRLIAEAVDIVVFIDGGPSLPSGRKVKELIVVTGYESGRYVFQRI